MLCGICGRSWTIDRYGACWPIWTRRWFLLFSCDCFHCSWRQYCCCCCCYLGLYHFNASSSSTFVEKKSNSTCEQQLLVSTIDFRYITDAITPAEAIAMLKDGQNGQQQRVDELLATGYPCYTTQVGELNWFLGIFCSFYNEFGLNLVRFDANTKILQATGNL